MKKLLTLIVINLCILGIYAQKTVENAHPDRLYIEGKKAYDLQQYGVAERYFSEYFQKLDNKDRSPLYSETEYFIASCSYNQNDWEARKKLEKFKSNNPQSPFVDRANFLLGNIHFKQKEYSEAAQFYNECNANNLNKFEHNELLFKNGFSHLEIKDYNKAQRLFSTLLQDSTRYNLSAKYYNAYISYLLQDYNKALPEFLSLQNEKDYENIIPYYLFQIYYTQKKYDLVLKTGEDLLAKDPKNSNNKEIYRILGECYYGKKDYPKTIQYLSRYWDESKQVVRENMYMLGDSYFQTKDYKKSIECFQKVTAVEDAMTQNAYLFLGACYIKENNKNNARLCFQSASRMEYDLHVKEEAAYNYALVVYEQSYSPFNESITAFENFITNFPKSGYTDNVYGYMVNLYLTTKNYEEALASIEKIKEKNLQIYEARQRLHYSLGIKNFTEANYGEAIEYFNKSLNDGKYNRTLEASTLFWRGEAYYKLKDYTKASTDFETFVNSIGARNCDEFNLAHYNVGYSFFTKKEYDKALTWFRKYINLESKNQTLIADATNRIGDCYFNQRNFENATQNYAKVYALNGPGADYACFQEGFIQGLQKDYPKKISTLEKLIKTFPQSEYIADAKYEIGRAYIMLGKKEEAIDLYSKLSKDYPHSVLSRKGKLQTAMLYDEMSQTDNAIKCYKEIVDFFPQSVEAKTSLESLKTIYFEQNNIQGYADYVESLGGLVSFKKSEQDSLTYLAAERQFLKGEYNDAISSLKNYLEKFSNGGFTYNAKLNLANSYFAIDDKTNAINEYKFIASNLGAPDRELALLRLSEIYFDLKEYDNAISSMSTLDSISQNPENKQNAKIGILRCHNQLSNTEASIIAATEIIENGKILDPTLIREALYIRAMAYNQNGDSAKAFNDFKSLSENCLDEYGAEAQYNIELYFFNSGDLASAEKEIFEFIEKNTPHQYWLAKSFTLLSDIYMKQGKDFEAKQYLLSVRENYKGKDDIASEIKMRLDEIENREFDKIVNE